MAKPIKITQMKITFLSQYLHRQTHVNVLLPAGCHSQNLHNNPQPFKALTLLHGKSDDFDTWTRCSVVENLSRRYALAVIMPDGGNSFYTDMETGDDYYTFITKELREVLWPLLPLSHCREDNAIAGLSMGGYGALKIGLLNPDKYCAIGSFSGAVDIRAQYSKAQRACADLDHPDEFYISRGLHPEKVRYDTRAALRHLDNVFGSPEGIDLKQGDLFRLLREATESQTLPRIYQSCGTEDFLYEDNVRFRDYAAKIGADIHYMEGPGGHVWEFWNRSITEFVDFFMQSPST